MGDGKGIFLYNGRCLFCILLGEAQWKTFPHFLEMRQKGYNPLNDEKGAIQMKKFIEDFKNFALKGNVVDLAVGVVIGGAFGKIVTSLVNDIIMPLLSLITGTMDLSEAKLPMGVNAKNEQILLNYGAFLQNIIDFLIIALSIFIVIKFMGRFRKKEEVKPVEIVEEKPSKEALLLSEIRDLLKSKE